MGFLEDIVIVERGCLMVGPLKVGVLILHGALLTGKGFQISDILQHVPIVIVYHNIVHLGLREGRPLFEYLGGFPAESIA